MRILRLFFSFLVGTAVIGLIVGLIARELFLYTAVNQVRSAARELSSLQADQDFVQNCLEFSGLSSDSPALTRSQLRFSSEKEYHLEIVCQENENLKQVFRSETLPPLVLKDPGQSGLMPGEEGRGITFSVLGRTGAVYESESFFRTNLSFDDEQSDLVLGDGPITSCQGYGFECCDTTYQEGQELQNTKASDCPQSCFSACADKPVPVSFTSDPVLDPQTRVVRVNAGEAVEFHFAFNEIQADVLSGVGVLTGTEELSWEQRLLALLDTAFARQTQSDTFDYATINFGDGESTRVSDLRGSVVHTYTCDRSVCVYNATLQGATRLGIVSDTASSNKIQVEVR